VPHIALGEITKAAEGLLIDSWWKELMPAVEISHLDGSVVVEALDQAFADESIRIAGAETPTETQAEIVV
jgi:hypothetical protein